MFTPLRGVRTSSTKHVKKLHSNLRYAESLRGFTEIKQVSASSSLPEFNGVYCLEHFFCVEHPYIARKSEKSLDMGELTLHAEKTAC